MPEPNDQTLLFMTALIVCGACARTTKDSFAWVILIVASVINFAANIFVLDKYDEYWEPLALGTIDFACVVLLVKLIGNRMAVIQASLIALGWLAHFFLYLDLNLGTSMVYEQYEVLILLVSITQLSLGANGIVQAIKKSIRSVLGDFSLGGSSNGNIDHNTACLAHAEKSARGIER